MTENKIVREIIGSVHFIRINRPRRKNAIDPEMYSGLVDALNEGNNNDEIIFTVVTGTGLIFSSGSDFSPEALKQSRGGGLIEKLVHALMEHRKILIALVNGPAIGIMCTTLLLYDYIIASESAYFYCPFTELGLVPEGNSTQTFPLAMGHMRAARLLIFSEKLSAKEALEAGLVSRVIAAQNFPEESKKLVIDFERRLAPHSLLASKALLKQHIGLHSEHSVAVLNNEMSALRKIFSTAETAQRLASKFLRPKSKI